MVMNGSRERWIAAGLCVDCGGQCAVDLKTGRARSRCASCLERCRNAARAYRGRRTEAERQESLQKMREQHRGRQEARMAARVCLRCGGARTAGNGFVSCAACLQRLRAWGGKKRQERRGCFGPGPDGARAWSLGRNVPRLQGGKTVAVRLPQYQATLLTRCYEQFRERERARGQTRRTHAVSQTVREVVAGFARRDCPLPPPRGSKFVVQVVRLYLDAPTRAIVWDQARRRFGGNFSAALRAMIQQTAEPRLVAATSPRRRWDAWRDED